MNCEIYTDALEDFLDGEIDEANAARINSHVFACSNCAARLESLKQEKEIYRNFLFSAEPPNDLWAKFQAKLENEKIAPRRVLPAAAPFWKTRFLGLRGLRVSQMFAAALVVFGIGFGVLYFWTGEKAAENQNLAQTKIREVQLPAAKAGAAETADSFPPAQKSGNEIDAPQIVKTKINKNSLTAKKTVAILNLAATKKKTAGKQIVSRRENNLSAEIFSLNEQARKQASELKTFEIETARQIEKVELLLRTFRNARASETAGGGELYDVAYEKRQARKLLEKNARLRKSGEIYRTADALELLSRVEPYLLEIANLDEKTAPGKVSAIKERVANQNIIASLQIY